MNQQNKILKKYINQKRENINNFMHYMFHMVQL